MKRFVTAIGIIGIIGLYVFFIEQPIVSYTIYFLSFIITLIFKGYAEKFEISKNQAEAYSTTTVIVAGSMFYCLLPNMQNDYIFIGLILVGLLNISLALALQNSIPQRK